MKTIFKLILIFLCVNVSLIGTSIEYKSDMVIEPTFIRVAPSIISEPIRTVYPSTKIGFIKEIKTSHCGTWYELKDGYILKDFIKPINLNLQDETIFFKECLLPKPLSAFKSKDQLVLQSVHVREFPSINAKTTWMIFPDTKVEILKEVITPKCGTWYKIKAGYILKNYVKPVNFHVPIETMDYNNCNTNNTFLNLVSSSYSNHKSEAVKAVEDNEVKESKDELNNFFIGASIGFSTISVKQEDITGSIVLANKLDEEGLNLNLELGYIFEDKNFSTISLGMSNYDDIDLYTLLASYNYLFDYSYNPYLGVSAGVQYMKLTKAHTSAGLNEETGYNMAYGINAGIQKNINKNYLWFLEYKYLKSEHNTEVNISPAKTNIKRDNHHNLNIGIRYLF